MNDVISADVLQRLRAEVAAADYPLVFATISGAHLYGFPSSDSDHDLRGYHILPAWRFTYEARDYRHVCRGFAHALALQPDGSFRFDEIQAGAYELHVHVKGFQELIRDIEIPAPKAGDIGDAVDVGTLTLRQWYCGE